MKKIILMGASGSIGTQTIDILKNNPDQFELVAFTVGYNTENVQEYIEHFKPQAICIADKDKADYFASQYQNLKVYHGDEGLLKLIDTVDADLMLNSLMGFIGLKPTMAAIEKGLDIAIANKETLVAGGELVLKAAKANNVKLLPVDSEHSAILQCLIGNDQKDLESITLTASGGSFRDYTREMLKDVSKEQALNHPNWAMGEKITIDSATMMNKGLEVIEAHYLFDIDYDDIHVIQHQESIIHSFVTFKDSSVLAQLGESDMRVPIQFALTYPNHRHLVNKKPLDLVKHGSLNFKELSFERFPLIELAYEMGKQGGNMPVVMNSANEIAVDLFLKERISFLDIERIVLGVCNQIDYQPVTSIDDVIKIDAEIREFTQNNYSDFIEGD